MLWKLSSIFGVTRAEEGARAFLHQFDAAAHEASPDEPMQLPEAFARGIRLVRSAATHEGEACLRWLSEAEVAFRQAAASDTGASLGILHLALATAESMRGDAGAGYRSLQAILAVPDLPTHDRQLDASAEQVIRGAGTIVSTLFAPFMGPLVGGEAASRAVKWYLRDDLDRLHEQRKERLAELKAAVRAYLTPE